MDGDFLPASVGPYRLLEPIGSGAYATVMRAVHSATHCPIALKIIAKGRLRSCGQFAALQREVNVMKTLDHPFIAPLFEVLEDDRHV
jgi:serine/threonine protein kinase